jgi:hypothetical protein
MIWALEDEMPLFDSLFVLDTIKDLQTRIKRQTQKLELEIVDKEIPAVWRLELLSDKEHGPIYDANSKYH